MTGRDNFLTRWSRRKLDAPGAKAPVTPERTADAAAATQAEAPSRNEENKTAPPGDTATTAKFDIAKLPSLDTIGEATDVRAFLAPGVPPELTSAALRRAWAADPTIRDFRGLQENDWDFTDPNGPMGFGELPRGTDLKKLLAQVFDEAAETGSPDQDNNASQQAQGATEPQDPAAPLPSSGAELSCAANSCDEPAASLPLEQSAESHSAREFVHRDNIIASHNSNTKVDTDQPEVQRRHGRAMPKH